MGWNDHEPWFSKIEDAVASYLEEGYSYDAAYEFALSDVTDEMRDMMPGRWSK